MLLSPAEYQSPLMHQGLSLLLISIIPVSGVVGYNCSSLFTKIELIASKHGY